jgi:prepilin-type N-terminal cleavage/methylation domain-containing protein
MRESRTTSSRGFTIIELVVSIAIFAVMTALVVARYGTFNQSTLLTDQAYDLALTIRTAQTYGVSVKSAAASTNDFGAAYGVHFDIANPTQFLLFLDGNANGYYDPSMGDQTITTYNLSQGATISSICFAQSQAQCMASGSQPNMITPSSYQDSAFDVTFRRPNPDAYFYCVSDTNPGASCGILAYISGGTDANPSTEPNAYITLVSSDKSDSVTVVVRSDGEISVGN